MRRARAFLRRFAARDDGGPTVEFVIIFAPLAALTAFSLQIGLGQFFTISATHAAAAAARTAATIPIAHCAALRNSEGERVHELAAGFASAPFTREGRACLNDPSPCAAQAQTWTCRLGDDALEGAQCGGRELAAIADAARRRGTRIESLTVTYSDSRLGEVGGPILPLVTVTLEQTDVILGVISDFEGGALPPVTATAVGEALGRLKWEEPSC
ncbi:MAG: hypothetical protein AAGI51_12865 [Pseudomonadota bacterium]